MSAWYEPGTEVEGVWDNPGDPVMRIRATVSGAPYRPVRSNVDLRVHPAAYRPEFGPTA